MKMLKTIIAEITGNALYLFSALVYRTCRVFLIGEENVKEALEYDGPIIITSWHGMTMMGAAFVRRNLDLSNFVGIAPDDHNGRTLDVLGRRLGIEVFIMNIYGDSTLGMGRRLVDLMKSMRSGKNLIIHPDGPFGPAYKIKPGILYLAKKTRAMILPLGCYCRHSYHLPRWDRYTLPLPFSKIHIQTGKPILISEDTADLTEINQKLTNILLQISAQASANYYEL